MSGYSITPDHPDFPRKAGRITVEAAGDFKPSEAMAFALALIRAAEEAGMRFADPPPPAAGAGEEATADPYFYQEALDDHERVARAREEHT